MILVGIDVAKDKHDCFIQTVEGKVLFKSFSFANNYEGFEELYAKILSCDDDNIRVGLESTGHYSYNLLGFLLSKELPTFVFNPLSEYGLKAVFADKDRTPKTSSDFPVTNTSRGNLMRDCHKCGEDAVKNPLDSWI